MVNSGVQLDKIIMIHVNGALALWVPLGMLAIIIDQGVKPQ